MEYRYTPRTDFTFLASGNIFKHFSSMPSFPVRLGLELFERARHHCGKDKLVFCDPCCGSGFSAAVLGVMKREELSAIFASDVDEACVEAARCNLDLIERENLLAARDRLLGKPETSPERAAQLTRSLDELLPYLETPAPPTSVFRHDILAAPPPIGTADYVFADFPYGEMTAWKGGEERSGDPVGRFFASVLPILQEGGVCAVCGRKELKLRADGVPGFRRVDRFSAGKRMAYLFQKI